MGHPCIMGDATYDSLPDSIGPCRAGRTWSSASTGTTGAGHDGLPRVRPGDCPRARQGPAKAFICGGATIYRLALPSPIPWSSRASTAPMRRRLLPPGGRSQWELVSDEPHEGLDSVSGERIGYRFSTYRRRR